MFLSTILLLQYLTTDYWLGLFILVLFGLGCLNFIMSQRYIMRYLLADLSAELMTFFIVLHFIGSLILGLVLPNNFLVQYQFFNELYAYNDLWVPASMVLLLFFFLNILGLALSFICKFLPQKLVESSYEVRPLDAR